MQTHRRQTYLYRFIQANAGRHAHVPPSNSGSNVDCVMTICSRLLIKFLFFSFSPSFRKNVLTPPSSSSVCDFSENKYDIALFDKFRVDGNKTMVCLYSTTHQTKVLIVNTATRLSPTGTDKKEKENKTSKNKRWIEEL